MNFAAAISTAFSEGAALLASSGKCGLMAGRENAAWHRVPAAVWQTASLRLTGLLDSLIAKGNGPPGG